MPQPGRGDARRQLRHPRAPRPEPLRGPLARPSWRRIERPARELGLEARFFQTNSEGEFVEHLHRLPEVADAALINAGAWTHYSWAISDALDAAAVPAVEVHLSDVESREDWRKVSVFDGLVLAKISGKGPDGYREALEVIARELGTDRLMRRSRRPARRAGDRARARPAARHPSGQRPLPDRIRRDQRGLPLRTRAAGVPDRLPLHRAGRTGGRGLGGGHGRRATGSAGLAGAAGGKGRLRGRPPVRFAASASSRSRRPKGPS